ncbi:ABC transporter permease [Jiangella alkaliphila]|uniref:Putative ABC transport system permease protein n=1 Tax=Jiangella alkaliphila TaxID=419479 RepID=A0A1H2J450_9ACTN|nr:ABC transporter permease [Jiangella alkaliphila]SDU51170.1 putative ABC transport system permease protein [Jiangella alkaliphila]
MNWLDTLRTGWEAVRTHRLRSLLTIVGILIGIASVILTIGFGQGAQAEVRAQISALGSNLLIVTPGSSTDASGLRGGTGSATTLTMDDAELLESEVVAPDVAGVAPVSGGPQSLTAGSTNWTTTVNGATPAWLDVRNRSLSSGRFLTDQDLENEAAVIVLGPDTASELFGPLDPVGQTVMAGGAAFTVVGVLDSVGSSSAADEDDLAIVPASTASARLAAGSTSVSTIYVEAASADQLSAAYQEVDAALATAHGLTSDDEADYTISTQESLLETATETDRTLTILLAGIAGISLVVGGIGVMNIMLVSVTERIREIGLRKALGATPAVIRRQFLLEASVLGLAGGLLGAGLGVLGAELLPRLVDQPVEISIPATAGAIAMALAVGVGFGVYPAGRAAQLAPIDALRSE